MGIHGHIHVSSVKPPVRPSFPTLAGHPEQADAWRSLMETNRSLPNTAFAHDDETTERDSRAAIPLPRGHDFGRVRVTPAEPTGEPGTLSARTAAAARATQRAEDLLRHELPTSVPAGDYSAFASNKHEFRAVIRVAPQTSPTALEAATGQRQRVSAERERDATPGSEEAPSEAVLEEAAVPQPAVRVDEPGEGETVRLPDIVVPQLASVQEMDSIASTLTYAPTITQSGAEPSGFGETLPYNFSMSAISVTRSAGTFTVTATVDNPITFQVRTTTGPDDQTDIHSATDLDITPSNYPTVSSDLTPDMSDLNGRPPRDQFWAKDLTIIHERFHATEGAGHARSGVTLAQNWLNTGTAGSAAAVNTLLGQVPTRVAATRRAAMTFPGREQRAYADGAPLYQARADAIKARGDAGMYNIGDFPLIRPAGPGSAYA